MVTFSDFFSLISLKIQLIKTPLKKFKAWLFKERHPFEVNVTVTHEVRVSFSQNYHNKDRITNIFDPF